MTKEFIQKVLRLFLVALTFMCVVQLQGLQTREAHQFMFILSSMVLFSLILKNIWLTLFMWWTILLYSIFKFSCGAVYLTNIFAGCVFYYLTKISFKKEHIDFFINMVLCVLGLNLAYGAAQMCGLEFIFKYAETVKLFGHPFTAPIGFMGNTSITAAFIAMCIPLVATRRWRFSTLAAVTLFIPLFVLHSTANIIAAILALMFVCYFKYSKRAFYVIAASLLILGGSFFAFKFHTYHSLFGRERLSQWRMVMEDSYIHPVTGWGLDSFRRITETKKHQYGFGQIVNGGSVSVWDNPHNLCLSLAFEWGMFIPFILLGGYLRQCYLWFKKSRKNGNIVGLAAFIIAFFVVSMGHFPAFLARTMVVIVPLFALFEISTSEEKGE